MTVDSEDSKKQRFPKNHKKKIEALATSRRHTRHRDTSDRGIPQHAVINLHDRMPRPLRALLTASRRQLSDSLRRLRASHGVRHAVANSRHLKDTLSEQGT